MVQVRKNISKELYEKFTNAPKAEQHILVTDYLGAAIVCGYGLYGYSFSEDNGKYYLTYERGDSCD